MRNIYIAVVILFLIAVILFVGSFIYLEKEKHATFYYTVNLDEIDIGTIKIDKFVTEDKLLYKSASLIPFYPIFTNSKTKLILDKKYGLETYSKENLGNGGSETIYLENREDNVSFVAISQSEFSSLNKIPIRKGTFVFEEESPVTYLPIIENYDFKRGRAQGFNAITHFSTFLPPMKRFVTLTSIRDEYIEVGSKKIETEVLLLKIRNYPQGIIRVAKSDRSLVMLEMPNKRLKISRTFSQKTLEAKEYLPKSDLYITRDVAFKNKHLRLSGTLTLPKGEGKYPAVLLVPGPGPQDRNYQGFFTSIADYLSREGFSVLRFDKRGIGSSGGDFSSTADSDEVDDLYAALEYLASQKEVDPQRIAILSHSRGAILASRVAAERDVAKCLILMAPSNSLGVEPDPNFEGLKKMALRFKWSDEYLKVAMKSNLEIREKVKNSNKNWASISGKRCFLKKMREANTQVPIEVIKKIKVPVLILQGKDDDVVSTEYASILDRTLEEAGNANRALIYFGYLGHFFGKMINDGVHKMHYNVDPGVLETMKDWLEEKLGTI